MKIEREYRMGQVKQVLVVRAFASQVLVVLRVALAEREGTEMGSCQIFGEHEGRVLCNVV